MHCKSYSHFFSKKFQHICVSLDLNFNEPLTNDIVSFEQLGSGVNLNRMHQLFCYMTIFTFSDKRDADWSLTFARLHCICYTGSTTSDKSNVDWSFTLARLFVILAALLVTQVMLTGPLP